MKPTLASDQPRTPPVDLALLAVAILLMLGGAALLVADIGSAGVWIPLIAIGIAVTVLVQRKLRRGD